MTKKAMLTVNFSVFPAMQTERFLLRPITQSDARAVLAMRSDPLVMQYIPLPLAQHIADAEHLIRSFEQGIELGTAINWGISWLDDAESSLIGTIGFVRIHHAHYRAEIGYLLQTSDWNKGVMSEVIVPIVRDGFEVMGLHSIAAVIDPCHVVSEKLLQKNGFIKEAHFKEDCYFGGRFWDSVHYSLLSKR